jgi:hypothetical protein
MRSKLLGLMNLALCIDRELQGLAESLSQNRSFKAALFDTDDHTPETVNLIFHDTLHIHTSLRSSQSWNGYRAARIVCNSVIVGLGPFQRFSPADSRTRFIVSAEKALSALIDEVCESVSFHLLNMLIKYARNDGITLPESGMHAGVHRAEALIFVLIVATGTVNLDPSRKMWIKDKIARVGRMMGSGTLQMLAASRYNAGG